MINTKVAMAACFLAVVSLASCSKNDDDDELNTMDREYMIKASISNTAEVSAATLALNKAVTPQVRSFAQHMITEHSAAQAELKSVGANVGVVVKDSIDPANAAKAAELNTKTGRAFDSLYIKGQVADHDATIALFQNEISNGRHNQVQDFASGKLPHIQMHRQRADSIATAMFK